MKEIVNIIQHLGKNEDSFISDDELEMVRSHKEEAAAYFHAALEQMRSQDKDETLRNEQLLNDSLFGLYFLAEWKDTEVFSTVGEILRLLGTEDDGWLGDALTENLPHIQYQLFDGDYRLLAKFLYDTRLSPFARLSYLETAIQKYLDERLPQEQLLSLVRHFEIVPEEALDQDLITFLCLHMMEAHVEEYLPDVRRWIDRGIIDPQLLGGFSDHLDVLYDYDRDPIIRTEYSLKKEAGYWYKFQKPETHTVKEAMKGFDEKKALRMLWQMEGNPYKGIGRNDPCPCGSGKKFKKCCLPLLENSKKGGVEPPMIRSIKARHYPQLSYDPVTGLPNAGFEKIPGRLYLEDRYDKEAIEIDYYVYLAKETLRRKPFGAMFLRKEELAALKTERKRTADTYFRIADELRSRKMSFENIADYGTFDQKFAIHFPSEEWWEER